MNQMKRFIFITSLRIGLLTSFIRRSMSNLRRCLNATEYLEFDIFNVILSVLFKCSEEYAKQWIHHEMQLLRQHVATLREYRQLSLECILTETKMYLRK